MLKKYTKKCVKICSLMKKEFDSESVYCDSDKYVKTNMKSYRDKINTTFPYKSVSKENTSYKVGEKYYPQTLLEECKYELKKNKMENLINGDLKASSSDSESDYESNNESDSECDNISDKESSNLFVEN